MPRTATPGLLARLADAALITFIRRGYRRTRVEDIAERAGVSAGTIYLYATGKDALFELAIRRAFEEPDAVGAETPYAPSGAADWIEQLWTRLMATNPLADLRRALANPDPDDAGAEWEAIARGLFRWQARYWRALALIESCASEWPELFLLFYKQFRTEALTLGARYLDRRARSGHLAAMPDTTVAVRIVAEVFAFFAMHRHTAPDSEYLEDHAVEETVIAVMRRAFVGEAIAGVEGQPRRHDERGQSPMSWFPAIVLVTASVGCHAGRPAAPSPSGDPLTASAHHAAVNRVELHGRDGTLTVRSATGDSVRVRVRLSRPSCSGRIEPNVLGTATRGGTLRIEVQPSTKERCDEHWTVELPPGVGLTARLERADVDLKDVAGPLDLRVGKGTLHLDVREGRVHAAVANGDIVARTRASSYGRIHIESEVGRVGLVVDGREVRWSRAPGPGDWITLDGAGGDEIALGATVGNVRLYVGQR